MTKIKYIQTHLIHLHIVRSFLTHECYPLLLEGKYKKKNQQQIHVIFYVEKHNVMFVWFGHTLIGK